MIRRPLAFVLAVFAVLLAAAPARAQIFRNFTPRFTTNDNGGITLVGNTLMSCTGGGNCTNARNGNGNNQNNNDWDMQYVDVDGNAATLNSSQATLTLPAGATVLWAGLYWGGFSNAAARNTCRFATPAAAYATLTADQLDATAQAYSAFEDVTVRVQAGGSGQYTVGGVASTTGANNYAGWSLVVVYRRAADPPRNLTVFDGYAEIDPGASVNIPVSGFLTPPAGAVNTSLGVVAYEGDRDFNGDAFQLNATVLTDATNPADNFFNSSVSLLGASFTAKNPNYLNQLGFDADLVSANGVLANGATSATIQLTSTDDRYYPSAVAFSTELYQPVLIGNGNFKTVVDLNGPPTRPGDVLEYTVRVVNTGNDASVNTVTRDTIPANTAYVPGSLVVLNGPNAGAKSDASGDDQANFDAAGNRVLFRLGIGANAVAGGQINPGVQTSFRFRVAVTAPSPTGTVVSNQAVTDFNAAQLGTALTALSDADTTVTGAQRTNLAVTAPTISGSVFEDVNYGGGAGRARLASGGVARPGARVELYDATGAYRAFATTGAAGDFSFGGWTPGNYTVRVVDGTVTSSRPGAVPGLVPVLTFRTNATSGAAVNDVTRVGGESPGLVDAGSNLTSATLAALTTVTTTAQAQAPLTLGTADIGGMDFGFNFSTVVNANDAAQGSLRQFLLNSNALGNAGLAQAGLTAGTEYAIFMVTDGAAHPGLRAGLPSLLTGGVVRVTALSALPAITGALTTVDGSLQTLNVGNTNGVTLGVGGTVGVAPLAMPSVAGPEVEIRDGAGLAIGLDLQATDITIARLSAWGFGNAVGSDANAVVRIGAVAHRAILDGCVLGTPATGFTDPGAGARSGGDLVRATGGDDGIVRNGLAGFAAGSGIALTGGSDRWQVLANEIRGNAIGNPTRDGVGMEASSVTTVRGNRVADHEGPGIDAATSAGSNTLQNNTVTRSGLGAGGVETPGIRLGGTANTVDRCVLLDNYGAGVMVASTASTSRLTRNSMRGNGTIAGGLGGPSGQLGIDLLAAANDAARGTSPFVTLNDNADGDAGGNGLLNFPVIESAVIAAGNITLTGWARPGSEIELFVANPDPSGFGEGETWVASLTEGSGADLDATTSAYAGLINGVNQGSDNTNRFRFTLPTPGAVTSGARLTATATVALATSEFSGLVQVTGGIMVSGFGYEDLNHSMNRDGTEVGTGAALFVKLVASTSPATAQTVVAVDPVTGVWSIGFVPAGNYTLVLDDNAVATDVTATAPAGWIGTEAPAGTRSLTVVATNVVDQDFGLWHGSRVDGIAFRDDGAGGATANDGVRQGGESGLTGIHVRVESAACAGGVCDSTLTGGGGSYTLWIVHAASGSGAAVFETNASGWISTGGGVGTTGGTYTRATDRITFTPASGNAYTGASFGDVPPNQLVPPGMQSAAAGAAVYHPHTFVAGSAGNVTFTFTQAPVPVLPGWGAVLYRDLDCDGVVDAGEPVISGPLAVTGGQSVCLLLHHTTPAGAPDGALEQVTLSASMSYTAAAPALATVVQLDDRTTVLDAGSLRLVKSVSAATVLPGDVITYTIAYTNMGAAPLTAIEIQDMVPPYSRFQSASCGSLGAGLSACGVTVQPPVNGTGPVRWTLSGPLGPGATGSVTFQVQVE